MTDAKTMTAFLQQMRFHRAVRRAHRVHEPEAVIDRDRRIIKGMDEERRRRCGVDMLLGAAMRDLLIGW